MTEVTTFTPPHPLNTAVLFLVFNRLDTTQEVFQAIRKAKPPRLYVAADGARSNKEGEAEKVQAVRDYIMQNIDWKCEVKTLFQDENLGCKYAPIRGISWFFDHEEKGIILEDDCLPSQSFFWFCEWGLNKFRNNFNVMHINGNNFNAAPSLVSGSSFHFVALAQVWGWASWSDRWSEYQSNPFYLESEVDMRSAKWNLSHFAKLNKAHHLKDLTNGLDAWDYQWQLKILNDHGYVLAPDVNLISNLGDGPDATHTQHDNRVRLPIGEWTGMDQNYNTTPFVNKKLNSWYESKLGILNIKPLIKNKMISAKNLLKHLIKKIALSIVSLTFKRKKYVVASSGRSGSTMLTAAIAESLVCSKFRIPVGSFLNRRLSILLTSFCNRLEGIQDNSGTVIKTHDLFNKRFKNFNDYRFVFVYGDPLEAALSVKEMASKYGSIWVEKHIFHLGGSGKPDELFSKDVLNFEQQMNSWTGFKYQNVFVIHYDDIWKKQRELSMFLGFDVNLPERRKRISKDVNVNVDEELFSKLKGIEKSVRQNEQLANE